MFCWRSINLIITNKHIKGLTTCTCKHTAIIYVINYPPKYKKKKTWSNMPQIGTTKSEKTWILLRVYVFCKWIMIVIYPLSNIKILIDRVYQNILTLFWICICKIFVNHISFKTCQVCVINNVSVAAPFCTIPTTFDVKLIFRVGSVAFYKPNVLVWNMSEKGKKSIIQLQNITYVEGKNSHYKTYSSGYYFRAVKNVIMNKFFIWYILVSYFVAMKKIYGWLKW